MPPATSSPRPAARSSRSGIMSVLRMAGLVLAAVVGPAQTAAEVGQLKEVRYWSAGEVTRVALELTTEARYKIDRLPDPPRIYLDLADIRPQTGPGIHTIPVGDGIIRQIRVALTQKNVTRVVIDLETEAEFITSQLSNPDRVMVELRLPEPVKPAAPKKEEPRHVSLKSPARPFVPPPPGIGLARPAPLLASLGRLPAYSPRSPRLRIPAFLEPPPLRIAPPPQPEAVAAREEALDPVKETPRQFAAKVEPAPRVIIPAPKSEPPPEVRIAKPADRDRLGNRSLTRVLGLKLGRVVLDAGHGGHDTGSISRSGLLEKELVLDVTLRLGKLIEERLHAEVVYTRKDDTFIPLEKRTLIANQARADLFLSIHANSSPLRSSQGVETFYLNFTTSKEDLDVAARENAGAEKSIHELSDLLKKIALKDKIDESREFAARIQSAAFELSRQSFGPIRNRGVKKAPFIVLIGAEMPSVLTEIGFMTNAREEALLKKGEHRQRIAEALYKGIFQYTESLSSFSVAQRQ